MNRAAVFGLPAGGYRRLLTICLESASKRILEPHVLHVLGEGLVSQCQCQCQTISTATKHIPSLPIGPILVWPVFAPIPLPLMTARFTKKRLDDPVFPTQLIRVYVAVRSWRCLHPFKYHDVRLCLRSAPAGILVAKGTVNGN